MEKTDGITEVMTGETRTGLTEQPQPKCAEQSLEEVHEEEMTKDTRVSTDTRLSESKVLLKVLVKAFNGPTLSVECQRSFRVEGKMVGDEKAPFLLRLKTEGEDSYSSEGCGVQFRCLVPHKVP